MKHYRFVLIGTMYVLVLGLLVAALVFVIELAKVEQVQLVPDFVSRPKITETPRLSPTPYVFSGDPIRLAWFYRPPQVGTLSQLADLYDVFILTKQDVEERDILQSLGVSVPIPQYFRFDAIMNPGDCDSPPWRNQVAYNPGDFCMIRDEHPDWFLLDRDGKPISEGDDFYFMDPANPEWQAFFLERAQQSQDELGWQGVFLDNVEASFGKREKNNAIPAAYPTETSYQEAIDGFLAFLYTNYFQPLGRPLYANIISLRDDAVWFRYLQHLDGAMEEGWAVDWDDGYYPVEKWDSHLTRAEQTQFYGREVILISQGTQTDYDRQLFAFGSYLLINHGRASFRYADSSAYNEAWIFSNYFIDIGIPLGVRYQEGDVWKRDFSNGTVIVNPETHTVEIIQP